MMTPSDGRKGGSPGTALHSIKLTKRTPQKHKKTQTVAKNCSFLFFLFLLLSTLPGICLSWFVSYRFHRLSLAVSRFAGASSQWEPKNPGICLACLHVLSVWCWLWLCPGSQIPTLLITISYSSLLHPNIRLSRVYWQNITCITEYNFKPGIELT